MINLDKSRLVGKGLHREVYRHPENNNLCIKVVVHGNADESRREKEYYRLLEKRRITWDMIPRYHGDIETNLGPGSVFDLVLDDNGAASKTLGYYFSSNERTHEYYSCLSNALVLLKDYLLQHQIITMTLKPKNIVCQRMASGKFRLFVVDNIGNSDFIPICNYSSYLAKKKILRKWKHFEHRMLDAYEHNHALYKMLTTTHSHTKHYDGNYGLPWFIAYLFTEKLLMIDTSPFAVIV
jgi:hypothetical protein